MKSKEALEIMCGELVDFDLRLHDLLKTQEQYDDWFNGEAKQKSIEFTKKYGSPVAIIKKDLEVLEILKPFLKNVLEINEDGTEVSFKAVRYFSCYVQDINGNWNETEQIKKNKKVKEWLDGK